VEDRKIVGAVFMAGAHAFAAGVPGLASQKCRLPAAICGGRSGRSVFTFLIMMCHYFFRNITFLAINVFCNRMYLNQIKEFVDHY
jgi:hypothetical protein